MPPLLATKLFFPPARPDLILRPDLMARLVSGLQGPLTLVSATVGYGKTTLLSAWRLGPGRATPAAWLALDEGENDLAVFLTYLAAALDRLQPGLAAGGQALLQLPQLPPVEGVLTALLNDLTSLPADFVLVLDDYQVIANPAVHAAVVFILDHLPAHMHLAILTRSDPPLPLARLRARGHLTEIRAAHLRFTRPEIAAFLHSRLGLEISPDEVAALEARSEGWIAGLQLAALSLQGCAPASLSQRIAEFAGSHHYIIDYLVQEVLDCQPAELRDFLLYTALCERLTASLCDAVTGRSDGQAMLEKLEGMNLFLTALDDQRCWYRYHHLFGDVLRRRLSQTHPGLDAELHRRASLWYAANGFLDDAISHSLAARDWPLAAQFIGQASQPAARRGEYHRIKGWLDALSEDALLAHPNLLVDYAWATVLNGQFDVAEEILARAEPLLAGQPALQVSWLAARVWAARGRGQQAQAVELARQALAMPASDDQVSRGSLLLSLSIAYWHLGRIAETAAAAGQAARLAEETGQWHIWTILTARLALVRAAQGHLRQAELLYRHSLQPHPGAPAWVGGGVVQFYLAALYYEWNDLDQALEIARQGIEWSRTTGYAEFLVNNYRVLAYIHQARGEPEAALQALEGASQAARDFHLPDILWGPTNASRVHIALLQGDLERAAFWLERVQGGYGAAIHYLRLPLEPARLALLRGDLPAAAALLAERYAQAESTGQRYAQIEIRLLQALAAPGEEQALAFLGGALSLARPDGFVRVFLDQGPRLAALLQVAARRGIAPDDCRRLLAHFETEAHIGPKAAFGPAPGHAPAPAPMGVPAAGLPADGLPSQPAQPGLRDPLSPRELEILAMIAAGHSNKQIAAELFIAIGTVKRHTSNIFTKLDVTSRTQALHIARELGLL